MESNKPVIRVNSNCSNPEFLKEICAGIEEEGVPFEVMEFNDKYEALQLSKNAALNSSLGTGIGIDNSKACFYSTAFKMETPLIECLLEDKKALRMMGCNAGRYIKRIPFKLID